MALDQAKDKAGIGAPGLAAVTNRARSLASLPKSLGRRLNHLRSAPERPFVQASLFAIDQAAGIAEGIHRRWLRRLGSRRPRVPSAVEDWGGVLSRLFYEGARSLPFMRRFGALTALSVMIAALGILADSTAVVIGAMLVAPLLTPVLAIAASIVMGWTARVVTQSILVVAGAIGGVGLAAAASWAIPGNPVPLPGELLTRTAPNLLDLGIAVAAGAAGAYGQARRQASEALPGVAVAVALVPPLAAIGISLQLGEWQYVMGASSLFFTNIAGIVFAGAVTFRICGFTDFLDLPDSNQRRARHLRAIALLVLLAVIPVQLTRGNLLPAADETHLVRGAVESFLGDARDSVIGLAISAAEEITSVNILLAAPHDPPSADELAKYLAAKLDRPVDVNLQVLPTSTIAGSAPRP